MGGGGGEGEGFVGERGFARDREVRGERARCEGQRGGLFFLFLFFSFSLDGWMDGCGVDS